MQAIILASGRGSRLGALTDNKPKPMVEINGTPILEHLIKNATKAGIREYIISTGYLGQVIKDYFEDGAKLGVKIDYVEQIGKGPESAIFSAKEKLTPNKKELIYCFCADNILFYNQILELSRIQSETNAHAVFTLEQGEPSTIKRVKISGDKIIDSSTSREDKVLVYNSIMQREFLEVLYQTVKDVEEKAFSFAMNQLANKYNIRAANIEFMNINTPMEVQLADTILKNQHNYI